MVSGAEVPAPSDLLRSYGARAKKRFGQHFLTDPNILDRIVAAAGVEEGARVLEVGPGCGTLTSRLLHAGAHVTAIEIDRDAAAFLRHEFNGFAFELIEADALAVDLAELRVDRVAANLPYNVGTQIMFHMLTSGLRLERLALMFQREVADRIVAEPRTKAYGALTLQVAELAEAHITYRVKPGAFTPPPKVDSAVVVLTPHHPPRIEDSALAATFREVVTAGFAMRRKTLRNSLGAVVGKEVAAQLLAAVELDPRARAEELTFEQFLALATATQEHRAE